MALWVSRSTASGWPDALRQPPGYVRARPAAPQPAAERDVLRPAARRWAGMGS